MQPLSTGPFVLAHRTNLLCLEGENNYLEELIEDHI